MSTLLKRMTLSQEAKYLDAYSFIIKSSLAMFFAFLLGVHIPIANKDMISFLFGLMMSLEPVNTTGFKRGFDQFKATLIGATVSAVIIGLVGINPLGLGLSIGAILYLTLTKNWRELSVVALFTGIYMTQFVQLTPQGDPDIIMTLLVRVVALTSGIVFAMVANGLSSLVVMPKLPQRRIAFLKHRYIRHLSRVINKLETDQTLADKAHLSLANLFNDIDWTVGLLTDLKTDPVIKVHSTLPLTLNWALKQAALMRDLSHYLYDLELHIRTYYSTDMSEDVQVLLSVLKAVKDHLTDQQHTDPDQAVLTIFSQRIREDLIELLQISQTMSQESSL